MSRNAVTSRSHASSHTLTVGERGRVLIPAGLRQELGIALGATLLAHIDDGCLVLEPRRVAIARLRGMIGSGDGRSLVDELLAQRRAEAALEEAEAGDDVAAIRRARDGVRRAGER